MLQAPCKPKSLAFMLCKIFVAIMGDIQGLSRGYIGRMAKKMETTHLGQISPQSKEGSRWTADGLFRHCPDAIMKQPCVVKI